MALRHPKPKVTLSLTPLIDVVFILLVFFMLASEFSNWQSVSLAPQASLQTADASSDRSPVVILLKNNGQIDVDGAAVQGIDAVVARLNGRTLPDGVLVRPEDQVVFQTVVSLVDALARNGVTDVKLAQEQGA